MINDVNFQLGRPPLFPLSQSLLNIYSGHNLDFMEAQISPSTVVADKETGEDQLYRPCLPQYPSLPSIYLVSHGNMNHSNLGFCVY
jgi:hypothetical protein